MKVDLHAFQMDGHVQTAITQLGRLEELVRRTTGSQKKEKEREVERQREHLLGMIDNSLLYNYMEATGIADEDALRNQWAQERRNVELGPLPEFLKPPTIELGLLPPGSFFIQFEFKLLKPYISRDDNDFYVVDNPIVRDKVFRFPLVRSTAWKGSLTHALWQLGCDDKAPQVQRLFGTANDNDDMGNSGRLYFYPTFFTQTSLDIINPHDRERRVGKNPILMEAVPAGARATFTLLYTPLDRIGKDVGETVQQISADLQLVAAGLETLFTVYGFGAKTSSGFGLVEHAVHDGTVVIGGLTYESKASALDAGPPYLAYPGLPRYLIAPNQLHPDFATEDGSLKSETKYQQLIVGRGQKYAKRDKQLYDKAKGWWERVGQQLAQQYEPEVDLEPAPEAPPSYRLARETFATFSELQSRTQKLADTLRQIGSGA